MAAGDLVSATVDDVGWSIDLEFAGMAVGITYAFGINWANYPSAKTPTLAIVSMGFDQTGAPTTIARTTHLCTRMRQAYPNAASMQESINSNGNLVIRVAMSTPVYAKDTTGAGNSGTLPVLTLPAGVFTDGNGVANTPATMTVVNNSTLPYPSVIANWARPDRYRVTARSLKLAAAAFHGLPQRNQPVACVKFTVADAHSNTATATCTGMTVDSTFGDRVPVNEHIATVDLTALTDGDLLTANFVAYPWIGDTAACVDTAALAQNEITGQNPSSYYTLDIAGSRGYPMAVVDPVNGVDASGVVYSSDTAANQTTAAAHAYLTLHGALNGIRVYQNTNLAKSNTCDAIIYVRTGTAAVTGATGSIATSTVTAWTWLTITPFPGDTGVYLTPDTATGNRAIAGMGVRFKSIAFTRAADADWFRGASTSKFLLEDCTMTDTRTSNTYTTFQTGFGRGGIVRTTMSQVYANGVKLQRGNYHPLGKVFANPATTMLGNEWFPASTSEAPWASGVGLSGGITAFNRLWKLSNAGHGAFNDASTTYGSGMAIVQNLFEFLNTSAQPGMQWHADAVSGDTAITGGVIMNNHIVGQRNNTFYQTTGGYHVSGKNWTLSLNWCEYFANKSDTFTQSAGGDGTRIGNWNVVFGVLCRGNRIHRGQYDQFFQGLYTWGGDSTISQDAGFISDLSAGGPQAGSAVGGGDYHIVASSYIRGVPLSAAVPYDLDGVLRNVGDVAAGCYAGPYNPVGMMAA